MKRFYYISDDLDDLEQIEHDLDLQVQNGVVNDHIILTKRVRGIDA